jgi:hypothetical protein
VLDQILEMEGLHIKLLDPRKLPSILPAVCEKQCKRQRKHTVDRLDG